MSRIEEKKLNQDFNYVPITKINQSYSLDRIKKPGKIISLRKFFMQKGCIFKKTNIQKEKINFKIPLDKNGINTTQINHICSFVDFSKFNGLNEKKLNYRNMVPRENLNRNKEEKQLKTLELIIPHDIQIPDPIRNSIKKECTDKNNINVEAINKIEIPSILNNSKVLKFSKTLESNHNQNLYNNLIDLTNKEKFIKTFKNENLNFSKNDFIGHTPFVFQKNSTETRNSFAKQIGRTSEINTNQYICLKDDYFLGKKEAKSMDISSLTNLNYGGCSNLPFQYFLRNSFSRVYPNKEGGIHFPSQEYSNFDMNKNISNFNEKSRIKKLLPIDEEVKKSLLLIPFLLDRSLKPMFQSQNKSFTKNQIHEVSKPRQDSVNFQVQKHSKLLETKNLTKMISDANQNKHLL